MHGKTRLRSAPTAFRAAVMSEVSEIGPGVLESATAGRAEAAIGLVGQGFATERAAFDAKPDRGPGRLTEQMSQEWVVDVGDEGGARPEVCDGLGPAAG